MSILTLYRPNFCSECGAKIIRLRWYFWTSRKFCNSCTARFRKEHLVQPALAVLLLLFLGIMFGRAMRPKQLPLVIQRNIVSASGTASPQLPVTAISEDVYSCGARTKKGTPCSRRVHGAVRCWQHKGLPPMLPLEKLKIKE